MQRIMQLVILLLVWQFSLAEAVCQQAEEPEKSPDLINSLDPDFPFGFDWDMSEEEVLALRESYRSHCLDDLERRRRAGHSFWKYFERNACTDKHDAIILPMARVPEALRPGRVEVTWYESDAVDQVTFSYEFKRNDEATARSLPTGEDAYSILLEAAEDRFGEPDGSPKLLVIVFQLTFQSDEEMQPCAAWLRKVTAVVLCYERLNADWDKAGITFFRLDRVYEGVSVLEQIRPDAKDDPVFRPIYDFAAKGRAEWLWEQKEFRAELLFSSIQQLRGHADFARCRKEGLVPPDLIFEKTRLSDYPQIMREIEGLSVDDLLEYAAGLDLSPSPPEGLTEVERDHIVLVLYKMTAEMQQPSAMYLFARHLLDCSLGTQQDMEAARNWMHRGAQAGAPSALAQWFYMQLDFIEGDWRQSPEWRALEKCSAEGNVTCKAEVGRFNDLIEVMTARILNNE